MKKSSLAAQLRIKSKVGLLRCPIHKERPKVELVRGELTVTCCCEKLRRIIADRCADASLDELKREVEDALLRAWKKPRR